MSWGEAIRLTGQLATLPDSHIAAAIAGWEHPVTREGIILMDLFDLQHQSKSKRKPQPYPRPWPNKDSKRFGRSPYTPEKTRAILDAHRHGTRAAQPQTPPQTPQPEAQQPTTRQTTRRRDSRGRFVAAST